MEKENVTKFSLEAAFKALDELDIPSVANKSRCTPNRVNLQERLRSKTATELLVEDYFDVNDQEDLGAAQEEREAEIAKAKLARIEKIVDLDAETEDDILPSYVGKFIIQCPQCMTLFYKNEEDIENSEENPDVVNINEVCQHCGNASGYTLVGKVGSVEEDEMANFDLEDVELTDEEVPAEEEVTDESTEEEPADETASEGEEDLDLNLNLDELEPEDEDETNESIHKSKLLAKIKKDSELATENKSEYLALNENVSSGENLMESIEDEDLPFGIPTKQEAIEYIEADSDLQDFYNDLKLDYEEGILDNTEGHCNFFNLIEDKSKVVIQFLYTDDMEEESKELVVDSLEVAVVVITTINTYADTREDFEAEDFEESVNKSKLLKNIEKKNKLKTEEGSKHLTLNEESAGDAECTNDALTEGALQDKLQIMDKLGKDQYLAIVKALGATNNELDKNPKYLKNGKRRYFFTNSMPLDLQVDHICDIIIGATAKVGCNLTDVMDVFDVFIAKLYSPDALSLADDKLCQMIEDGLVENLKEDIADWYRKKFDKPASIATQQAWETRHSEPVKASSTETAGALVEDAYDNLLDELWSGDQPTESETEATLANFGECLKEETNIDEAEDFDEKSFNEHLNKYMTEVYSNVSAFEATECSIEQGQLIVEGKISFKSGKSKQTTFVFESSHQGLLGHNKDFADGKSFLLKTNIKDKTIITEGLKYRYRIGESLVRGTIRSK